MSERARAPRSGGRTVERDGVHRATPGTSSAPGTSGARGARRYPAETTATRGTAALKLDPVRATEPADAPRLRVAPPAPISAPRAPFVAVVIALVVAGVLGILVINTKTNENAFRISNLENRKDALDTQEQELRNQIAGYETAGNLHAAARRLGLVRAETPAFIRLPDGRIIGVPQPGKGEPAVTAQDGTRTSTTQDGTTTSGTQDGTTQDGTAQNSTTQNGTGRNGTAQNGTAQNGTAQQGGTVAGDGTAGNGATGTGTVPNGTVQGAGQ